MTKLLKLLTTLFLFFAFFNNSAQQIFANAYRFNTSNQSGEITCQASELGCEWAGYANFVNDYGDDIWFTTAWVWNSSPGLLKYSSWTKGWTSEQDTDPSSFPVQANLPVSLALIMRNPGVPGTYRATIYLDGKACNRNTTPWDCYYMGAGSFTITMTVVGNPTATPTTIPPTATPTTRPPSATPTPTELQPTITPTPTTPSGQTTPTPTSVLTTPTPTSANSQTNTANSGSADTTGTQTKPKTCEATIPNTPKLLSVKPISQTSVTLEWTAVSNATHYSVSYGTKTGVYTYGVSNTGKTTSFTVKSLGKNSVYYFVVQAIADCAPSKVSNEISTTIDQTLPEKSVEEILTIVESSKSASMSNEQAKSVQSDKIEVDQNFPAKKLLILVIVGLITVFTGVGLMIRKSAINPVATLILKAEVLLSKLKKFIQR